MSFKERSKMLLVCWLIPIIVSQILLFFFLALWVSPCRSEIQKSPCVLLKRTYTFEYEYFQEGDIIIGGIFTVNTWITNWYTDVNMHVNQACSHINFEYYAHLLAFIFTVDEINKNPDILPNVTVGYYVFDSCGYVNKAIKDVIQIISGRGVKAPNYSCKKHGQLVGFIGDIASHTTMAVAQMLNLYGYPQISYGATDVILSDRRQYPYFYRTVQGDEVQYTAILKLLKHFGCNWVGIITTGDDSGERTLQYLTRETPKYGICIEFSIYITKEGKFTDYVNIIRKSTTEIIIISGSYSAKYMTLLMKTSDTVINKTLILPASWSHIHKVVYAAARLYNCSLVFTPPRRNVPKMKTFVDNIHPSNRPNDPLLEDIWICFLECLSKSPNKNRFFPLALNIKLHKCTWKENTSLSHNFVLTGAPYFVYTAVYAIAWALNSIDVSLIKNLAGKPSSRYSYKVKLNNYLKNIHYKDSTGSDIYFDEKGELPVNYDIINQIILLDGKQKEKIPNQVGTFDSTLPDNQQMHIEIWNITWKNDRMPRLRCTEMCHPGFRKALREGYHICCYDCIPCSEGEFSNLSDSEDCFKCPENEWPDQRKTKCIPKTLEFLSYETDVLALVFCVTSIFSVLITTVTVVIFFSFRDTPIIKANNRNLSFVLLGFLKLSFLCVFLFIGRPLDITCMIRHISFGMAFSAALSCVLAKTIMVCIAFKATKPGSTWRNWMGLKVSNAVVLVGSSGQVLISVVWLLLAPPFQELDMHAVTGKIIVQCNEGSVLAFFCMLGYMGLLAAVSFVLAFMVRTLPDNFNEAKHITFSMLVFCSVWVCAIPAYLSSKGKNMVAVEIFATLASSLGIVSCIYLPKCYMILFKADLNTKQHLLGKTFL